MSKRTPTREAWEQEIDNWCSWFVTAHETRLRDAGIEAAGELAAIVSQADAIRTKMRSDYLTIRRQP